MALELATLPDLDDYQAGDPTQLLTAAEAVVRAYCGWHIAPSRTETITTVGIFTGSLFLPTLYLTAVVSVTEDGTLLTAPDYTVHREGYVTRVSPSDVVPAWGTVTETEVVFTHGYTEVPADVQQVVLALANRNVNTPGNLIRVGQVQYGTGADQFTDAERATLRHYRIPPSP